MNGILNVNKPAGYTSHDVVNVIRRLTGERRCGHTGTLDPGATGVLPVCVGKATRVSEYVLQMDKTYRAAIQLGTATDTEDAQGQTVAQKPVPALTVPEVEQALSQFLGISFQIPPMYSAIRQGGRRLYEYARQGQSLERAPRKIEIYCLKLLSLLPENLIIEVKCSRGTYVRTLCREIAEKLGTTGHMAALIRVAVGPFLLENAQSLEEMQSLAESGQLPAVLLPMDTALSHLPAVRLPMNTENRIKSGLSVCAGITFSDHTMVRVYNADGCFIAIGMVEKQCVIPKKVFSG